ncbi:MAG: hypothetical protein EOM52_04330 [Clostridia bacterium]|nr:hypothetical protein [Clostridia bacterium]
MKERVRIPDFNALWTEEVRRCDTPRMTDDGVEAREILLRYIPRRKDGNFEAVSTLHSALVWWVPRERAEQEGKA